MIYLVYTAYINDDTEYYWDMGFMYGWLSPNGDYELSDYGQHEIIEEDIIDQYYGEDVESTLESLGWIRICHAGYLSTKPPTDAQWEVILAHAERFGNEYTMDPEKSAYQPGTWTDALRKLHNEWIDD
jgi:hypothetical protein